MANWDHTSKTDLLALRAQLANASVGSKAAMASCLTYSGLMIAPLPLRPVMALLKLRFGETRAIAQWAEVLRKNPKGLDSLWKSTLNHLTFGRDQSDPRSAGGFNEEELASVVSLAELSQIVLVRKSEPEPAAKTEVWLTREDVGDGAPRFSPT